jgi:hypothetical protein
VHARHAVGARLIERPVALVGVGLQDAVEVGEVRARVLALVVGVVLDELGYLPFAQSGASCCST